MLKSLFLGAIGLLVVSCASHEKRADISPTSVPMEEIAKLEAEVGDAYGKQIDVLASKEFRKSKELLKEAREDVEKGKNHQEVLNKVAEGRAHLKTAAEVAVHRTSLIPGVINARRAAIDAGANKFPPTGRKMSDIDDELRSQVLDPERMSVDDVSVLQKRYLDIELTAIISTQLGKAAANIDNAINDGANSRAKVSLKRAQMDFRSAENLISANRNETSRYSDAVSKASDSAEFLNSVVTAIKKSDDKLDEQNAAKVVTQERKISNLQSKLGSATEETAKLSQAYDSQGRKLRAAGELVNLQAAIESARKRFLPEEADVFQQGSNLLIRLKSIKFRSGRVELPETAYPVLAKVQAVALELHPESVVIEGHTDSVGNPKLNKALSEDRAMAVANYFGNNGIEPKLIETNGYGFEKPIASNKTKTGRELNRRVDIIVTPGVSTAKTAEPAKAPQRDAVTN